MEYKIKDINEFSKNSQVLKLLKTPYVLFFLHKEFIESNKDSIPETEFVENWRLFRTRYPDASQDDNCTEFIRKWMNKDKIWVIRQFECDKWIYKLSRNAYQAFQMYEELNGEISNSFTVPVNEYFSNIINSLRELSDSFDTDKKKRIQSYDKQILEYEEKIKEIKEKKQSILNGGAIEPPSEYRTVELFSNVMKIMKQMPLDAQMLVGNLNIVYEELKKNTQDDSKTRNEILQDFVNGRIAVEESVSGKAFKNLLNFFANEELRDWVIKNLEECKKYPYIGDVAKRERPEDVLLRLYTFIVKAGNELSLMYNRIHELVTVENFKENRSIRALLNEIMDLMIECKKNDIKLPPLRIENKPIKPNIQVGTPRINLQLSEEPSVLNVVDAKPVSAIVLKNKKVDKNKLKANLLSCMTSDGVDLSDVIKKYPLSDNLELEEILAYIEISSHYRTFNNNLFHFVHHNKVHDIQEAFSVPNVHYDRRH